MALPKGFRNNIRLTSPNVGVQRRQDLLDNIADDGTFLPRGVHYQDMDETFINFVNKELRIEIDGEEVPVLFLTLQRYSEFTKTWKFTDEYKNIKIPFITIVRKPDPQVGTNQAGLYNIPGRPTFTYYKVPTNDGARVGVDLYKIPQPTSVDITYEVRMFTNKMSDLNLLNEKVQKKFQSRQAYIWPKGHPMPVTLESIGDESNIDDFENRRFYVQPFEMLLAGYILDEEDFEIMPTINRAMVMSELIVGDGVTTPVTDGTNSPGCVVAAQGSSIIKNTAGTLLSVVGCGSNYVVGTSLVFNSGNTYSQIIPATTNLELPNVLNIDSDGSPVLTPAMVGFTATTCDPVTIINSGATYSASTPAGSTFNIPNTHIFSTLSGFTDSTPSVSTGYTISDIDWTDSDSTPQSTEYGGSIVCTPCVGGNLSIGVFSDSGHTTPITEIDFNETAYITATVIGFTATDYTFTISGGGQLDEVINQVGSSLSFVSHRYGDVLISVVASDGVDSAGSQFELTANWDWDNNIYADGVNDYLGGSSVIFNTTPDYSMDWSLSMWFKLELPLTGTWLFYIQNTRYGNGFFRALFTGDNINIRLMADPNVDIITPFTHDENWHNLVVTRADNKITYWIDGVVYVNTGWGQNGFDSFRTTGGIFRIGSGTLPKGYYRDMTFWRRGLVQADVDQIWNSGNGGVPPLDESIGYWRPTNVLGTTSGTVNDSTNQGNVINFNGFSAPYGVVTNQV